MEQGIFDFRSEQLRQAFRAGEHGKKKVASHNYEFLQTARRWARNMCRINGEVTIDDVRLVMTDMPSHRNAWGCVFHNDDFICVGMRPSRQKQGHGRYVRVWKLR